MEADRESALTEALEREGLRAFSRIIENMSRVRDALRKGMVKLIFAPTDEAIGNLLKAVNKTGRQFLAEAAGKLIIENHFATVFSLTEMVVPALSGEYIPLDHQSLAALRTIKALSVLDLKVIIIQEILMTPDQKIAITKQREPGIIGQVGANAYGQIIDAGGIKGRDLIALCLSNSAANAYCDEKDLRGETIFHRLLRSEFGREVTIWENARDVYRTLHSRIRFYVHNERTNELELIPGGPYQNVLEFGRMYGVGHYENYIGLTIHGKLKKITRKIWASLLEASEIPMSEGTIFRQLGYLRGSPLVLTTDNLAYVVNVKGDQVSFDTGSHQSDSQIS